MQYPLNGQWNLRFTLPETQNQVEMLATVPGNVEIELEKQGYLTDCMPSDNVHATTAFDSVDDWTYSLTFDAPDFKDGWTRTLVFEGIDTIADIFLNGEKVYEARNMFVAHRISLQERLRKKDNELKVIIRSALNAAKEYNYDIFSISRASTGYGGQTYLRKARHEWGWDNAPRLLTSGLYRSVYIESLPPERFSEIYLYTGKVMSDQVQLGIIWQFETPAKQWQDLQIRFILSSKGNKIYDATHPIDFIRGAERFSVPRDAIELWWPRGFGEASLCDITIQMLREDRIIAEWKDKWGVRTLRLERTENITDDDVGEFVFVVNNERVYINGCNWKPLDALHSRADAKVEKVLDLALDLNCNMVRIWGGGIYEDTPFFDYCDRNGIMVWQDFMFGCEFPPMDDWYCKLVEWEANAIVRKLRNHASLAVWCGDNEDDECLGWTHGNSTILPSDNRITREILKNCVLKNDPYRSYIESSPYISDETMQERRTGRVTHHQPEAHLYPPTMHYAESLRACRSRLIGETGPIIINAMTDNERIFAREKGRAERLWDVPLDPTLRNLMMHQTDDYFQSWRQTGKDLCKKWFGRDFIFKEWKDYCLAVNIICGDVFKDAIEYCRTNRWNKTGVIWWSLYDMWPMLFNYSVVDVDFHKKMPYYWIKQSQQYFALLIVRREMNGKIALYTANDTLERHLGEYKITAYDEIGSMRIVAVGAYDEVPNTSRMIQRLPEKNTPELWIIEWSEHGKKYYNHFVTGEKSYSFEAFRAWTNRLNKLYGAE